MLDEPSVSAENPRVEVPTLAKPLPHFTPPEPRHLSQQANPEQLLNLGAILGVVLVGLAAIIAVLRDEAILDVWFGEHVPLIDIGLGLVIGVGVAGILWRVGDYVQGFQDIRARLIETLDFASLQWWQIMILSLVAAFPEEIFFRGALQPLLGLVLAAVVFGALHSITRLYFAYATLAGLGFGLMVMWRGDLWMAIAAHFAIDFVGLGVLKRWVAQQALIDDTPADTIL